MYKVFVNNKPVFFLHKMNMPHPADADDLVIPFNGRQTMEDILKVGYSKNSIRKIYLITQSADEAMHHFLSYFKIIHAAGGIVINGNNELLVIYRNGIWDLPKGKIERDESPQEGAMREVCEETGICNLAIIGFAEETWHTYYHNQTPIMKHTSWYKMKSSYTGEFKLQKEEGIEEARWIQREEVKKVLNAAYPSIAGLIENHFLNS
ncbi:MAG: NUDIX domain-containing protein [Bacteroidia bacterium]|nr:NUDIX domain-containing protein [Bacteroidia bacterium]